MKLGIKIDQFAVTSTPPENLIYYKERELYASKKLELKSLAVYFDVYDDSFLKKVVAIMWSRKIYNALNYSR